jgi:GrpB-like predicted nucleotidyltransferase (UPF0157 family)
MHGEYFSGRMIVPYDPLWPEEFLAEAGRIVSACQELEVRVEHIGSTAVPGLSARPVIDIAVGVPPRTIRDPYIQTLKELGYEHRDARVVPGRDSLQRGSPRSHHVHLVSWSSDLWRDYLHFRDYLRKNPAVVSEYGALKRQLSVAHAEERLKYQSQKAPFIQAVLRQARAVLQE